MLIKEAASLFNFCEGLFWLAMAGLCFVKSLPGRTSKQIKRPLAAIAAILLLFGISDFVEMSTGSWYRPWWLLLWKAASLTGIAVCFLHYRKNNNS